MVSTTRPLDAPAAMRRGCAHPTPPCLCDRCMASSHRRVLGPFGFASCCTSRISSGLVLGDRAEEARLAFGGSLERLSRDRRLVAACLVVEDRGRLEREAPVELGRLRAKRRPERFEDLELDLVRAHLRVDDLDARRFIVPYGDAVDLERAAGHLRAHELAPMHLRREEVEVLGDVELGDFPLAVLEDLELSRVGSEIERDLESSTSAPPTVCLHGTGGCASCRDGK